MARVTMHVDSRELRRIQRRLGAMPERIVTAAQDAVEESGEAIREDVAQNVGVFRGLLKRKVRVRKVGALGLTADVGWFDRDTHYARFVEFGTSSITANPVLTVASEMERPNFPRRVRDHIEDAI